MTPDPMRDPVYAFMIWTFVLFLSSLYLVGIIKSIMDEGFKLYDEFNNKEREE